MPVAMPTWRNVLFTPAAIPARCTGTTLTAVVASGGFNLPHPSPPDREPRRAGGPPAQRLPPVREVRRPLLRGTSPASQIRHGTRPPHPPRGPATTEHV